MDVALDSRVQVGEGVMFRKLGDESVLLDLTGATYFGLDDVGTRMWEALLSDGSVAQAARQLQAEYAADPATIERDLLRLVQELVDEKLLRVVKD